MNASPDSAASSERLDLPAAALTSEHVLVGESGGLSQVYEAKESSIMPGMIVVETEHGFLYLDADPDQTFTVVQAT